MKSFFKQVSIYGILPVVGKFVGFFLIPIYARVFSAAEFGTVELIITLVQFLMFACNLEFYTAIGRFFYDCNTLREKQNLISTGFFLTLFFTLFVSIIVLVVEDFVFSYYLKDFSNRGVYRLSVVWLFFTPLYTYLSVIPRYDKRPKLYVLIHVTSLIIRVTSTILFVLYFRMGVSGVIAGHLTGSIISFILNFVITQKYLSLSFSIFYARKIGKFSIPIVPGLLIVGFWHPFSRNLISEHYSLVSVGYLGFAMKITSLLVIVNSAIKMAWSPMLFEDYKKPEFELSIKKLSNLLGKLVFLGVLFLTLLSPEIVRYVGTEEYFESIVLIGFLSLHGGLEILQKIRGFGPLINNKTYILTIVEIIAFLIGVLLIITLRTLDLIGIGLAFIGSGLVKYTILFLYTKKTIRINLFAKDEVYMLILFVASMILVFFETNILVRFMVVGLVVYWIFPVLRSLMYK